MVAFILGIGLGIGATRYYHHFFDPVKYQAQPLLKYIENLRVSYRSQPEVPGINVLCYDKAAVKFVSPVFYKLDLRKDSQELHSNESKELCFDDFFRFTGFSQRILVQGRPGSGKTTLVNRLTKEWLNQTKNSNIAEYPLLLRVTLREVRMDRSSEKLSILDILRYSLGESDDIEYVDEEICLSLEILKVCIIFDGLESSIQDSSSP